MMVQAQDISYTASPNYEWHRTTEGVWERDLDEAEIFYASLRKAYEATGRMFFAITGHVLIELSDSGVGDVEQDEALLNSSLQQAWLALRRHYPTLATRTEFDLQRKRLKKVYQEVDEASHARESERWLSDTFQVIPTNRSGLDWCNNDPLAPDLASLFVLMPAHGGPSIHRTLVLRSPHDLIDGIGTLQILGQYLRLLSNILDGNGSECVLKLGTEHERLTPPLRVAARLPLIPGTEVSTALEDAERSSAALISEGPPSMTVPLSKTAESPSAHQRTALRLMASKTVNIIRACSLFSVSVTHAYHAAAAIVLASRQPRTERTQRMQYVSYALINLRGQCFPPYDSASHAVSVYHCTSAQKFGITFTIPPSNTAREIDASEFQRVLLEIKSYYVANRPSTEPMLLQMAPLLWHRSTPHVPDEAWQSPRPMQVPPPNKFPSISMSSFGTVDRMVPSQTGRVSAHNPWVTGEELDTGIGLFLGTYRGELELSAAYNAAWHDEEEIQRYLRDIQAVIETGLGLGNESSE